MLEETARQSELPSDDDSASRTGRGPAGRTPVAAHEKAASEQAARDELVRARNKRVRAHRSAPGPDGPPAFSDHAGSL